MPTTKVQVHTHAGEEYIPIVVDRLPGGSFIIEFNNNVTLFFPNWEAVEYFVGDFNNKLSLFNVEQVKQEWRTHA